MAFPTTPLVARVELQLGGVWTDITGDVRLDDGIGISRGRADEAGKVDHAKCSLKISNRDGRYSPRNPLGPYYGRIGRNTPIRVSVIADTPRIVMSPQPRGNVGAWTPDATGLDPAGDIDVRMDACLTNWHTRGVGESVELCGKSTGAGNQRSWALQVRDSRLHFEWSADGIAQIEIDSTAPITVPPSGRLAVRAALDVDNGAGGWTATFYTAASIAGPWTQLGGAVTGAGTTSVYNSSAPLWVGTAVVGFDAQPCRGEIYHCQVRAGATLIADLDATTPAPDSTTWADSVGRTWTLAGATHLHDRRVRFVGEISEWPSRWDVSGADVWVPVDAAGVMRRLGKGASPLHTATWRALLDQASAAPAVAYWPLDEGQDATQAASALADGQPMTPTGSIVFGAEGGARGGAGTGVGTGDAAGVLSGTVNGSSGKDLINFWIDVPAEVTNGIAVQLLTPGAVHIRTLVFLKGTAQNDPFVAAGHLAAEIRTPYDTTGGGWQMFDYDLRGTGPHMVSLYYYVQAGVRILRGYLDGVRHFVLSWSGDHAAGITQARIGTIRPWEDEVGHDHVYGDVQGVVGDLSIQALPGAWTLDDVDAEAARLFQAGIAHAGETAAARITRLCHEAGVYVSTGASTATEPGVGFQTPQTLLELLGEAAEADGGIQHEPRDELGILFRDHATLLSQPPALAIGYGDLSPDLEPTEDDAHVRNDVTASRPGGSSARRTVDDGPLSTQAPPHGVGRYDESLTVNVSTDAALADAAQWRAHLGTWDEARYPVIRLDLAAKPHLIPIATLVDVGDRATVADLPPWLPPEDADVLLQGYSERIGLHEWDLAFNCTPGRPWDAAVVDDGVYGRVDTDGCALAQAAASGDTQIWAYTPAGPTWVSADVNLLANNSFEAGTAGWTGFGGTMARINSLAVDGAWSLQLTPDGVSEYPALQYQLTAITGGDTYRLSAWMRCTNTRALGLNVNWYTAAGAYLDTSSIGVAVTGGTWTYASGLVTAPAGAAYAQVSPTVPNFPPAGDRLTIDDVRLATTDGRGLDLTLNPNPGVEAGGDGWAGDGGTLARVNDVSRNGAWSLRLTPNGVAQFPAIQSLPIPVQGGRTYRPSAWVRCAVARVVGLNVNWHTVRGAYLETSTVAVTVAANTWTRADGLVGAPAGAQLAVLAPTMGGFPPNTNIMWADDVRLSIPADPAIEFPFDITVGGEVMTVTAVADQTSPQLLTVTRAVNGITKSHAAGTDIRLLHPAVVTY